MSTRRRFSVLAVAATLPAAMFAQLFACGPDGHGSNHPDSGIHLIDSSGGGGNPDGSGGSGGPCTATADYGTPDLGSPEAGDFPSTGSGSDATAHEVEFDGHLNADASYDLFALDLYAGYGGFGSGDIQPGTYQITGDETNFATCGVCALILTDVHMAGSGLAETDDYMATGGTVTLDTVSGGTFSGSVSNLTFTHVMVGSDGTTTPIGDCDAKITSVQLSATLQQGSGTFTGTANHWGNLRIRLTHRHR